MTRTPHVVRVLGISLALGIGMPSLQGCALIALIVKAAKKRSVNMRF